MPENNQEHDPLTGVGYQLQLLAGAMKEFLVSKLVLTRKGKSLASRLTVASQEISEQFLAGVPAKDVASLRRMIKKMLENTETPLGPCSESTSVESGIRA